MKQEPIWIEVPETLVIHDRELARTGGMAGVRELGMLESALARPRNIWAYGASSTPITRLAAAYGFGISSNHPFLDGNKRTALLVSFTFLDINDVEVTVSQEEAVLIFLSLAAGDLTEEQLSQWFERNTAPR